MVLAAFGCVGIVLGCATDETSTPAAEETTADREAPEESSEEPDGIGDGTHHVPDDIAPDTYRSTGDGTCY
jgi:hypothetical protein